MVWGVFWGENGDVPEQVSKGPNTPSVGSSQPVLFTQHLSLCRFPERVELALPLWQPVGEELNLSCQVFMGPGTTFHGAAPRGGGAGPQPVERRSPPRPVHGAAGEERTMAPVSLAAGS